MTTMVMPGLSPMLEASNKTRMGTVDALASQYQRMVQAVPLISMRWPSEPDGSIESPAASAPRLALFPNMADGPIELPAASVPRPALLPNVATPMKSCTGTVNIAKNGLFYTVYKCSDCDYKVSDMLRRLAASIGGLCFPLYVSHPFTLLFTFVN